MSTGPGDPGPRWEPTFAHHRAAVAGLLLGVAALVTGRADVLVLAVPLLVVAIWSAAVRPVAVPSVGSPVTRVTVHESEHAVWRARVSDVPGLRGVVAHHPPDRWLELDPESGTRWCAAGAGAETVVDIRLVSTRWGRRKLGQPQVAAYGAWNAWRCGPLPLHEVTLTTLPVPARFHSSAPAPHPHGLVGINRAARPGEGTEFAKVRPFLPGDRLRRIHWPVSARTGRLHVTATYAEEDSLVIVMIDALNDIGDSQGLAGDPSSMDLTVRAAGAIVEHHLRRGDRVGLRVFGCWQVTRVPASMGRAQLRRVLDTLALIEPGTMRGDDGAAARQGLPADTLVILLSPLVDAGASREAVTLARNGLTVVVVDTLPPGVRPHLSDWESMLHERVDLAWRIRTVERRLELERLASLGIPVVPWRGERSMDQVLVGLARRGSAPRIVGR
jgi:uncharacterized protein (DUF58 family)